jgi:hypothetical protein
MRRYCVCRGWCLSMVVYEWEGIVLKGVWVCTCVRFLHLYEGPLSLLFLHCDILKIMKVVDYLEVPCPQESLLFLDLFSPPPPPPPVLRGNQTSEKSQLLGEANPHLASKPQSSLNTDLFYYSWGFHSEICSTQNSHVSVA